MASDRREYGTRFMYAEDLLVDQEFIEPWLTISHVYEPGELTAANKKKIDKFTIGFKSAEKLLVLSATNRRLIHTITGIAPGPSWVGQRVQLFARSISAFGKDNVLCIRVKPPDGTALPYSIHKQMGRSAVFTVPKEGENDEVHTQENA